MLPLSGGIRAPAAGCFSGRSHTASFHPSTKAATSYHRHTNWDLVRKFTALTGRRFRPFGSVEGVHNWMHCAAIDELPYTHGTALSLLLAPPILAHAGNGRSPTGLQHPGTHLTQTQHPRTTTSTHPAAMAISQLPHGQERPARPSYLTHHIHLNSSAAWYSLSHSGRVSAGPCLP